MSAAQQLSGVSASAMAWPVLPLAMRIESLIQHDAAASDLQAVALLLKDFAAERLEATLRNLLSQKESMQMIARNSYKHGNGFYKLVLAETEDFKLRLHVWEEGQAAEENIHEHRWHFASTILYGQLQSEAYEESFSPQAKSYREYVYQTQNGRAHKMELGPCRLQCTASSVRQRGDSYSMKPGVLHRIISNNGHATATLMCQSQASRGHNRMLSDEHVIPDVEKRSLTTADVQRLLLSVLSRLQVAR